MRKAVVGATLLATTGTAVAQSTSYRIDANATKLIDLSLCNSRVYVSIEGDHDTDLDFTITDSQNNVAHRDFDSTDVTYVTLTPRVSGGCVSYSLKVQNRGSVYNNFTVKLEDRGTPAPATTTARGGAQNRQVAIHNHTAETFRGLWYSNTADNDYGDTNRLASNPLRSGSNRTVNIDDGSGACHFDIKVETASGRTYHKRDIDVCKESSVEFGTEIKH